MDRPHRKTILRYAELFPLSVSQGPKRKAAPSSHACRFLFQVDRQKQPFGKEERSATRDRKRN